MSTLKRRNRRTVRAGECMNRKQVRAAMRRVSKAEITLRLALFELDRAVYTPEDCQGCGTPTNNAEGGLCKACSA